MLKVLRGESSIPESILFMVFDMDNLIRTMVYFRKLDEYDLIESFLISMFHSRNKETYINVFENLFSNGVIFDFNGTICDLSSKYSISYNGEDYILINIEEVIANEFCH